MRGLIVVAVAVVLAGAAQAEPRVTEMSSVAHHIGAMRSTTWECQDALGHQRTKAAVSVWALPRSVAYRNWVAGRWRDRSLACEKELARRTIPATNDWAVAVTLADRIYPGTKQWALSCSGGEGGHGGWVRYGGGSYYPGYEHTDAVGGWMQFRPSTFYAHVAQAFDDARSRGFILNPAYESWLHPIGQAVTAAYMRAMGWSHIHWDPGIDWRCR